MSLEDEYFETELLDFIDEVKRIQDDVGAQGKCGTENVTILQSIIDRCNKENPMPKDQHVRLLQSYEKLFRP